MTETMQNVPIVRDGEVVCPFCGGVGSLLYAFDTPTYCRVVVQDDKVVAVEPDEDLSQADGFRLFCCECSEELDDVGIDIV
jgi:hypothetical protein